MTERERDKAFEGRWRFHNIPTEALLGYDEVKKLCRDFFEIAAMIESGGPVEMGIGDKSSLDRRKERFYGELMSYLDKYPQDMIEDFYVYWSEPNRSKTKMRFEMEKTWSLSGRLATWAKRDFNRNYGRYNNVQQQQQQRDAARMGKLAVALTTE